MSLLTLMQADAASLVLNTNDAAQSVTHRPLNVAANDTSVTAVFSEDEPQETEERGVAVRRMATLVVGSGVSVDTTDRWVISGTAWNTKSVQTDGGDLKVVRLVLVEEELRSGIKRPSVV